MTRPADRSSRHRYALRPRRTRPRLVVQTLEDRTTPAQFLVTSAANSGPGTLREAVDLANASPAADEIVFDTNNLFATPQTITLAGDRLIVLESGGPLTITGPGKDRLTVDGNDAVQFLRSEAPTLALSGFTVANAYGNDFGAIFSYGVVRLDGMVIRDSRGDGSGGGIFMAGDSFLHVRNSVISGNSAGYAGGGIYMYYHGSLVVENSTVSGNTAAATSPYLYGGGGIHFWGDASASPPPGFVPNALVIRNSTIANNSITGSGGGINLAGFSDTLRVENSTITGNTATGFGGGIRLGSGGGTIVVSNSVVAGNTNANAPDIRSTGTVTADHSAIGSTAGFTLTGENNVIGQDPLLGPLQDNGGPTPTTLPQAGSPLIDAGPPSTGVLFDQRGFGFLRTYGPAPDIGAVEVQPAGLPFGVADLPPVTAEGGTAYTFTVTYHDLSGTAATGLDVSTLIDNDAAVRVTGPSGFDVPAAYVSIDAATDGTPRTVTYEFTPPGGAWDPADSGAYQFNVRADAVEDVEGNAVPAGRLGTLTVSIPRTLVVTTAADAGAGSLREAIGLANETPAADRIVFDTAGAFATPQTILLAAALPEIAFDGGPLTIAGPGTDRLTVDGNDAVRVLSSAAPDLSLSGFTIARGATPDEGGGLRTSGVTTLDGMVIRDSHAEWNGGGVWRADDAFLAVRNTTVSGNSCPRFGAGIFSGYGGGLVVENSTVSGNTVVNGGQWAGYYGAAGILVAGTPSSTPPPGFPAGAVVVRNSTVANNSTDGSAGGIGLVHFFGTLYVENSTVSGNVSEAFGPHPIGFYYGGGGIRALGGDVRVVITNSVVAGNVNPDDPDLSLDRGWVDAFNSAFGDPGGWASPDDGNLIGEDYRLGPLQDNGGPTFTMAPQAGSPLIDAGDNVRVPAGLTVDQRGLARVDGPAVDIGAVETQRPRARVERAATQADPTNVAATVTFDLAFDMPVTGFDVTDVSLAGSTAPGTLTKALTQLSSTAYRLTVTGATGSGTVVASIPAGVGTDPNTGLTNLASTSIDNEVTIDLDAPTVTINQAVGQADPTNVSPVSFDVVFNEPVVGFDAADVRLDGSTVGGMLTPTVTQTGPATYTVNVTGMTGFGTVVASVPAAAAADLAGNVGTASTSSDNSVLFGETAPAVTVNRAADQDDPTSRPAIKFDVAFSEPVTGFEAADVSLAGSTAGGPLAAETLMTPARR